MCEKKDVASSDWAGTNLDDPFLDNADMTQIAGHKGKKALSRENQLASTLWGKIKKGKVGVVALLSLVALSILAYWPILNNTFVADDYVLGELTENMPFKQLWRVFTVASPVFFRPLSFFSWWVEVRVIGQTAWPAHLMNVSLHGGSAYLLFWLLIALGATRLTAITAAVLLVLTPIGPEAVTWASGRPDVFSFFFTLLALSFYTLFIQRRRRWAFAAAVAAAAAALLSKEAGIIVVPLLLALELLFGGGGLEDDAHPGRRRYARLLLPIGLLFGYLALRLVFLGGMGGYRKVPLLGLPEYDAVAMSLGRLLAPLNSLVFSQAKITWLYWYTNILLLTALALVVVRWRRGSQAVRRVWLLLAIFFLTSLLPVYGFVFMDGLEPTLYNSRYLYAPTAAIIAMITVGLFDFGFRQRFWRIAISSLLILLMSVYLWGLNYNNRPWERAAAICSYVPQETQRLLSDPPRNAKFYFNNVPFWDGAYIFAIGLPAALRWEYQRSDLDVVQLNPGADLTVARDGFLFNYQNGRLRLVRGPLVEAGKTEE